MALRDDFTVPARGPVNRRYPVYTDQALTQPANLAGWTAAAQARPFWASPTVLHTFTCVVESNAVRITATGAETADWPMTWSALTAVWDLVLTDPSGNDYAPLVGGLLTVAPYITRP